MMIQIHCLCLYLANVVLFFSLFGGDWSDPIRYVHYWECPPSWLRGISSLSGRLQGSVLTLGGDRLQGSVCTLHGGRLQGSVLTHAVGGRLQGSMRTDWSIVISLFLFFHFSFFFVVYFWLYTSAWISIREVGLMFCLLLLKWCCCLCFDVLSPFGGLELRLWVCSVVGIFCIFACSVYWWYLSMIRSGCLCLGFVYYVVWVVVVVGDRWMLLLLKYQLCLYIDDVVDDSKFLLLIDGRHCCWSIHDVVVDICYVFVCVICEGWDYFELVNHRLSYTGIGMIMDYYFKIYAWLFVVVLWIVRPRLRPNRRAGSK